MALAKEEQEKLLKERRALYEQLKNKITNHLHDKDWTGERILAFIEDERAIRARIDQINEELRKKWGS